MLSGLITIGALVALLIASVRLQRKERKRWLTRCQAQQIVEYTEGRQWER